MGLPLLRGIASMLKAVYVEANADRCSVTAERFGNNSAIADYLLNLSPSTAHHSALLFAGGDGEGRGFAATIPTADQPRPNLPNLAYPLSRPSLSSLPSTREEHPSSVAPTDLTPPVFPMQR